MIFTFKVTFGNIFINVRKGNSIRNKQVIIEYIYLFITIATAMTYKI